MKYFFWSMIVSSLLLTACDGDPKPKLATDGHWLVDHGLSDNCQVSATFADSSILLTFYSLLEGACRPEDYGIQYNTLVITVDAREDFFNDQGVVSATLNVSAPEHGVTGVISLQESSTGIEGSIVEAQDPNNLLIPLVGQTHKLTALPRTWESMLLGTWGLECTEINVNNPNATTCPAITFSDETHGIVYGQGAQSCSPMQGSDECVGGSSTLILEVPFIYALRNVSRISDEEVQLDMVVIIESDNAVIPMIIMLNGDTAVIKSYDELDGSLVLQRLNSVTKN